MKKWNFKIKSNPQENIKKLDSALDSIGGFIFNMDQGKNDSAIFNFRKPVKYPDQILHRNRIVVKGKVLKAATENETDVEISFMPHFFMTLTVISVVIFGLWLIGVISETSTGASLYLFGGLIVAMGIALWVALQKKFERDVQEYKTLISEILES